MAFCTKCGTEQQEGAKFCKTCGQPMDGAQPPVAETPSAVAAPAPVAPSPTYPAQPYTAMKPRRNKLPIILGLAVLAVVVIVVVVLVFTLGGSGGIAGQYRRTTDAEEILELKTDGTFTLSAGIPVEGTYETSGKNITLHMELYGYTMDADGTIEGGKISLDYGDEVYVKQ